MSKIVESVLNLFNVQRRPKSKSRRRDRRSMLEADSFVYLPGDNENYWGDLLNGEPISALAAEYSEQSEMRRRAKTAVSSDETVLRNGKMVRRLSGTLVSLKARRSLTEVGDGSLQVPETDWRPRSQDLTGRYVYDRLLFPPKRNSQLSQQARYSPRHSPRHSQHLQPGHSQPEQKHNGRLKRRSGLKDKHRSDQRFEIRCSDTMHSYCEVEVSHSSEYAVPVDAIDWRRLRDRIREGMSMISWIPVIVVYNVIIIGCLLPWRVATRNCSVRDSSHRTESSCD